MILVVNFKKYKKGKAVLKLAKLISRYKKNAIVCIPFNNIKEVSSKTKLRVFSQHLTSQFNAKKIKSLGAKGTLLNHNDHRISLTKIKKQISKCNSVGLKVILCASTLGEANRFKQMKVYAVAYEDKILVGSGKSITTYKPKLVKKFANIFKKSKILPMCGAGISTKKDISIAKKLGCKGVLIASAIAKNKNPKKLLKDI